MERTGGVKIGNLGPGRKEGWVGGFEESGSFTLEAMTLGPGACLSAASGWANIFDLSTMAPAFWSATLACKAPFTSWPDFFEPSLAESFGQRELAQVLFAEPTCFPKLEFPHGELVRSSPPAPGPLYSENFAASAAARPSKIRGYFPG
jgi:hypothetical protein